MSGICLLAATAVGVVVAALSDFLPALYLSKGQRQKKPLPASNLSLKRCLPRTLLFTALTLMLAAALNLQCGATLSSGALLEFAQLGLFLLTATIDIEHRRIFPVSLGAMAIVAFAMAAQEQTLAVAWTGGIAGLLAGFILFAGGRLYLRIMRRRRRVLPDQDPFGAADALLAGACGIYTGWPGIALALLVGFMCVGAAVVPLLLTRKLTLASTLPFAPFLLAGTLLAMRSPDVSMLATRLFG